MLLVAVCLLPAPSYAAEPAQSQPGDWYGWQILVIDVADAAVFAATAAVTLGNSQWMGQDLGAPLGVTGAVFYVAGGPTVHLAHGHVGRAAISVALRVGTPLVFGLIGAAIGAVLYQPSRCPPPSPGCYCDDSEDPGSLGEAFAGMIVGAGVGVLTASAIDIAILAREPASGEPANPSEHSAQLWPSLVVLPTATTARDAGNRLVPMFGIAGTF
jgi:hypothetical protein